MNRAFTNILCGDVEKTALFYEMLLGMTRSGDFGWFVLLGSDTLPGWELGILDMSHDSVPSHLAARPAGMILTFVVDDVETLHNTAVEMGAEILQEPTVLPYGQTRLLLRDPTGSVVDISSPTA